MIMIMAMIIMRKMRGVLIREAGSLRRWWWAKRAFVVDGALVENYSDKSWFVAWLSLVVMRSWHSGCPWWEGRLGQYRTLWCWELSGKKIWFISWASWASELPRIGWRSDLTVVSESVRPYKVKWNVRHSCEHLVRTEHWNLFSQQFEIGEHGNTPNTLVACGLQIRKGTDR